jgi:hypothetical protein
MAGNVEGLDLLVDTRFMGAKQLQKKSTMTKPICQAMLLCDTVIRDESTHNTTVVGIFGTFCGEMSLPVAPLTFDQNGDYHMVVFTDEWEMGRA